MSYTPTTWATGDVITAEKLNNMESGIVGAGSVLMVRFDLETGQADKTWNEIANCMANGGLVLSPYSELVGDVVSSASTTLCHLSGERLKGVMSILIFLLTSINRMPKQITQTGTRL